MRFSNPAPEIKTIVRDTLRQIRECQLLTIASSLAYTTILSIIPALAVSFAIFQAFGGLEKLYGSIEPFIIDNLAEGASQETITHIRQFISNAHAKEIGVGGMIGLIFTSMTMFNSFEKAIHSVWRVPMTRSLFQRIASYWLIITLGPLALSVAVGFASGTSVPLMALLPSGTGLFAIAVAGFYFVYKYVPHCKVNWRSALGAAIFTAALLHLARLAYVFYIQKAVTYSKIYGSLGAIPILLLWIYILWVVTLTGAALSAALQKRVAARANLAATEGA